MADSTLGALSEKVQDGFAEMVRRVRNWTGTPGQGNNGGGGSTGASGRDGD